MRKSLTVEQYTFYKTKHKPLSDMAIMGLYGLNNATMNAWKKKNNLIGVKFKPAPNPNPEWEKRQETKEEEIVEKGPTICPDEVEAQIVSIPESQIVNVPESDWTELHRRLDEFKDKNHILELNLEQYKGYEQKYIESQQEIMRLKKELKQQDRALEGNYGEEQFLAHLMKKYIRELETRLEG